MKQSLLLLWFFPVLLFSTSFHVGLTDSYAYHSIQAAVDQCAPGDTVWVHPGTYSSSITVSNKSISILSNYAVSGEESDIENTIISGNGGELNIIFNNGTGRSVLQGFMIRDCVNSVQAVLAIQSGVSADVMNCYITNNRINKTWAPIMLSYESNVRMSACKIYKNYSWGVSGIWKNLAATLVFDPVHRNSLYSNYGGFLSDIWYDYSAEFGTIPLDTLYLDISSSDTVDPQYYWGIKHIVVNQVSEPKCTTDLYVAPWGNDTNTGTEATQALRTIYQATRLACPAAGDSLVIHIASGRYSFNNFDDLRLNIRPGVILRGDPTDYPILDGDGIETLLYNAGGGLLQLENLAFQNSFRAIQYQPYYTDYQQVEGDIFQGKVTFKNLRFWHNYVDASISYCQVVEIEDLISIEDPLYSSCLSLGFNCCPDVTIKNSIFRSKHGILGPQSAIGGASLSYGLSGATHTNRFVLNIINSIIADNYCDFQFGNEACNGIALSGTTHINLINSIIVNNSSAISRGASIRLDDETSVTLYNSVVWNNRPYTANILTQNCRLDAYHSLIEAGAASYIYPNWALSGGQVNYDETNLPAGSIPLFTEVGPHDYMPKPGSAVIDAGSQFLPEGVSLPAYDLAGNPRVYGARVDLGPYEWQGTEFDFSYNQNGATVSFVPSSNEEIRDIHWDFDMDGVIDSEELMPTYTYTANASYSVGCYINGGTGGIKKENCIQITTGVNDPTQPLQLGELQVYPNPFAGELHLRMTGEVKKEIKLSIYDIKGRLVRDITHLANTQTSWNGCDNKDKPVANGIYFVRMQSGSISVVKKIVKLQ